MLRISIKSWPILSKTVTRLLAGAVTIMLSTTAHATVMFTPPPGLSPGDTYRLVFLSSLREPLLNNFLRYDYVVTQAASGSALDLPSTTWRALGAFEGRTLAEQIEAGGNINDPVFRVDGVLVTGNAATLLAGDTTSLTNLINVDESGNANIADDVWTSSITYFPTARIGLSSSLSNWFDVGFSQRITERRFYAISDTITVSSTAVPSSVPEPTSMAMLGSGVLLVGLMSRLRQRRRSGGKMTGVA